MQKFKYIDSYEKATREATMFVHGDIGFDVIGAYFTQEVSWLEAQGCTNLKVRINSGGGLVIDAYSIFSALQQSKMEVETINEGIAASAAGWIWMAGAECKMMDYAIWMGHNVKNGEDGSEDEVSKLFTKSICRIICNMTGKPEEEVCKMLEAETFMDSSQMINAGMCKRENVIETTKKPKIMANDAKGIYAICNQFLKDGKDTIKKRDMSKINNMLKLSNEASEDAQSEALGKVLSENETLKKELESSKESLSEVQEELKNTIESLKEFEAREKETQTKMALELVENAVKEGKIEEAQKATWLKLANTSFEDCKAAINGIVKKAPHVSVMTAIGASNSAATGRDAWTIRDWETKDVDGLRKMKAENKAEYDRLFKDFYIDKKHKA